MTQVLCIGGQYNNTRQEWDGHERRIFIRPPMKSTSRLAPVRNMSMSQTTRVPAPVIYAVDVLVSGSERIYFAFPEDWTPTQALKYLFERGAGGP